MVATTVNSSHSENANNQTAKLHVNAEVANLVKIYCVLNNKKMKNFTSDVLSKELHEFKEQLRKMRNKTF